MWSFEEAAHTRAVCPAPAGIGYRTVTLYCFVPRVSGDLSAFVAEVRRIMRGLKSQLRPTGNEGIEMLEEDFDARSQSLEYQALRAILS